MSEHLSTICRAVNQLLCNLRAVGVSAQDITDVVAPTIKHLERERDEAQSIVKTLSAKCDKIETDKEYNADLVNQLRAINAELLEALEAIIESGEIPNCYSSPLVIAAQFAITKAKEPK